VLAGYDVRTERFASFGRRTFHQRLVEYARAKTAFRAQHRRLVGRRDRAIAQNIADHSGRVCLAGEGKLDKGVAHCRERWLGLFDSGFSATHKESEGALLRSENAARHCCGNESDLPVFEGHASCMRVLAGLLGEQPTMTVSVAIFLLTVPGVFQQAVRGQFL